MVRKKRRIGGYSIWIFVLLAVVVAWLTRTPERRSERGPRRILEWPQFETSPEAIQATRDRAITEAERSLASILAQPLEAASFAGTLVALDALDDAYARAYDRMALLYHVSPDPELRAAASEAAVALEQWYVDNVVLGERLYALVAALAETDEAALLVGEDRKLLDDTLADFRREGLTQSPEDRAQIAAWQARLAELTTAIDRNINDAEGLVGFRRDELEGLDDAQLQAFEFDAATGDYLVRTALAPQYDLIMQNATLPSTRRRALEARQRRAMDSNAPLIAEVLRLRTRLAAQLGYETWADYRIEPYMAGSPEVALGFEHELGQQIEPRFLAEQLELRDLARADLGDEDFEVGDLRLEDIPYYMNMLRERKYDVDAEVVKQYFAEDEVLRRIFAMLEQLFGLEIVVVEPKTSWAEDLDAAMISDASTGELLGVIYLDLHPRPGKYTHFATFELIDGRRLSAREYQAPVLAIVGNFPVALGDQPSLWTLEDVETMLHELGHALHGVLTEATYFAQSGLDVPWDFVEVPSQMLERWLEDPAVLRRLAVHYQTGAPMPDELVERIVRAARVDIGHVYRRDVALGLVDFAIHGFSDVAQVPASGDEIYQFTNSILATNYYDPPENTAMLAAFGHLFGGYDGGYYSYAWSDAIVADLRAPFIASKLGFADPELGARLRREILAVGGSRPVADSIHAFLGRDWGIEAFFEELVGN